MTYWLFLRKFTGMRYLLVAIISVGTFCSVSAQGILPGSYIGMPLSGNFYRPTPFDTITNKKWSLQIYGGISTGISFFNGGSATFVAAPMGLQLSRKLSENIYAFAGVNIAPTYINLRQNFLNTLPGKSLVGQSLMYQPNSLNMSSRVEMGLMYTNDQHTFQISGSVGVERRSSPALLDFRNFDQNRSIRPLQ